MTDSPSTEHQYAQMPIPTTISPAAQAILAASMQMAPQPNPEPGDAEGWAAMAARAASTDPATIEAVAKVTTASVDTGLAAPAESYEVDGAKYFIATPEGLGDDDRVLYFIHGGGFVFGGGATASRSTELVAGSYGVRTWGIDYRQLPTDPYPAGLDDVLAVYRALLAHYRPDSIALAGQSGGSNLAAALLLRAHDEGLPLPVAVGLISPPADLTQAGDTFQTNAFTLAPGGLTNLAAFYAGGRPLDDPYISPLFGDFTAEFPPTVLTAGTRDFLLSDTVRLHRKLLKAGVRAELHVWEGAPHGMFMGEAPEDFEQVAQVRSFLEDAWEAARAGLLAGE